MSDVETKARTSQKKAKRDADNASKTADAEYDHKLRCAEFEKDVRMKLATDVPLTTAPPTKTRDGIMDKPAFSVGSFVLVTPDLKPGKCSHGGKAWIIGVEGLGGDTLSTVQYLPSESATGEETGVPVDRITVLPPLKTSKRKRTTRNSDEDEDDDVDVPVLAEKSLTEEMEDSFRRGRGYGWRKKDLGLSDLKTSSYEFQLALATDFVDLSSYLRGRCDAGAPVNVHQKKKKNGQFPKRKAKYTPLSIKYLAKAWDVGINFPKKCSDRVKTDYFDKKKAKASIKLTAIDDRAVAKKIYTAKKLFSDDYVRNQLEDNADVAHANTKAYVGELVTLAHEEWKHLGVSEKKVWEAKAREHDERQPFIADDIVRILRKNPTKSFDHVADDIDWWCNGATILSSKEDYCTYVECALPLLTATQKAKHVAFATLVCNNWNLKRGKYLWLHYDEKWFWGFVARANAKKCEALGIDKKEYYLYHKCHIDKVMALAMTGYAFDTNVDNGGHGLKVGIWRVQGARIAKRQQRESRKTDEGKTKYDGDVIRRKGDVYLVDTTVTGLDEGMSDKPKFSLKSLFKDVIFPRVCQLVGPGGEYEGYTPIFQGDQAGPHEDAKFRKFCDECCKEKGFHWIPQAPQMPHMNNLDLAVFPAMSKRHSRLIRESTDRCAKPDEIWNAAYRVWCDLPSATIARGFVLAYRVAEKVVKCKGENGFLHDSTFHSNVRKDFADTPKGVKSKCFVVEE